MNTTVWLPPLIVLAVGILAGVIAAWRLRVAKARSRDAGTSRALEIADLEAQRDNLYRRLEEAADEGLAPDEVTALETEAARTLRDLDRLQQGEDVAAVAAKAAEPALVPAARGSAIGGFAAGVAVSGLIAVLVYWAVRDAKPDPRRMQMDEERQAQAAAASGTVPPHEATDLPPRVAEQVKALESRLAAAPDDLQARKELAMTMLAVEQYVPAFQHASVLLEQQPNDPDALFIHGVVRVAMNQTTEAVALLDRVLGLYPQHVYAQMYKGIALARGGERDGALAAWQAGLTAAGGSHREIEQLIAMVEGGALDAPAGAQTAPSASTAAAVPSPPPAPADKAALAWQAPQGWREQTPASPLRRAQYQVPGTAGDAELVVFYFGSGQGGDAMANAQRWADQFRQPDGGASRDAMTTRERNVGEMPVLLVEVGGTYTGGMSGAGELDDAMLLGAIARGPDANWFFKLTGPRATVESQRVAFDQFVDSLRVAG